MTSLFRAEVLEHRKDAWIGHIRVVRPLSLHLMTAAVVVVAAVFLLFFTQAHYTSKARVVGVLMPDSGVIRLMPPVVATIAERHATEGQSVRRGDVLFVLAVDRDTATGDTQLAVQRGLAERVLSLKNSVSRQTALTGARDVELVRRLSGLRSVLDQMAGEIDLHRQRLALAQQGLQRLESLKAENFVSPAHVQTKAEEVIGLKAQLAGLERQRTAQLSEIGALESQRRELPLRDGAERAQLEREVQGLSQERAEAEARHRVVVRAPQDAVVTAVMAEPGQSVTPGVSLASLVPAGAKLQAQLFAPSSAVGFVRPDQSVLLRFQAFPYQKFGHHTGRVVAVSQAPLQMSELASLPLAVTASAPAGNEPLYRITVELDQQTITTYGVDRPLSTGMQLEADVLLDRRRLIEWLFEPVIGMAHRV